MNDFTVNTRPITIPTGWEAETLLDLLRFRLGLAGVRFGCGQGLCGACTVLLDGQAVRACTLPATAARGGHVLTVEGFVAAGGAPAAVLRAWSEARVAQCGFCQSGQMAQAAASLNDAPATAEAAMSTVLCRCGTAPRVRQALAQARADLAGRAS